MLYLQYEHKLPQCYTTAPRVVLGSIPYCSLGDKWPKRWTFGQKQGQLFRLRRGSEPRCVLSPDDFMPAFGWLRRCCRALGFITAGCGGAAQHAVGHLPLQDRWQGKPEVSHQHQVWKAFAIALGLIAEQVDR